MSTATRPSINHLNLAVRDVAATREFFCNHFGFTCNRPNAAFSVLEGGDGFVLSVMALKEGEPDAYPGGFHIGFYVSEPEVEAMHARLAAASIAPGEISRIRRGTMFYVSDPNGMLVEVCSPR